MHYLEIVTNDMQAVCKAYEATYSAKFSEPDEILGGAKTCVLADGSIVGVREPLRETEMPVIRPYWLVEDIEKAVEGLQAQGAQIAVPPMEMPNKGKFAIYILGGHDHGLWEL